MTRFLLELGKGWAFVGRQKEIVVSGKTRKIDLLFYHIHLRFYIEEVQAQLPTTEQIKACIEQAEEEYLQMKKESESTE